MILAQNTDLAQEVQANCLCLNLRAGQDPAISNQ